MGQGQGQGQGQAEHKGSTGRWRRVNATVNWLGRRVIDVTLAADERGVVWRDGEAVRVLGPGAHRLREAARALHVEVLSIGPGVTPSTPELRALIPEEQVQDLTVKAGQLAIITVDGQPTEALEPGRYMLWQVRAEVRAWCFDTEEIIAHLSEPFARVLPKGALRDVIVAQEKRALIRRDGRIVAFLEPGKHFLWAGHHDLQTLVLDRATNAFDPEVAALVPADQWREVRVGAESIAVFTRNGTPAGVLEPGHHILWQFREEVDAIVMQTSPLIAPLDEHLAAVIPSGLCREVIVPDGARALVRRDGRAEGWLEPGRHYLWTRARQVDVTLIQKLSSAHSPEVAALVPAASWREVTVAPHELAIIALDGQPTERLEPGRHLVWQWRGDVQVTVFDTREVFAPLTEDQAALLGAHAAREVVVSDEQRGVVRSDGRAVGWLEPGKHFLWCRERKLHITLMDLDSAWTRSSPELRAVLPEGAAEELNVQTHELAIVFKHGLPHSCLPPAAYQLWQLRAPVDAQVFSTKPVRTEIPESCWHLVPPELLSVITVHPYERGLLYVDGAFVEELGAGRYGLQRHGREVEVHLIDTREQEFQIAGQEIMTRDKVTIRVNLIARYRVLDALKSFETQTDLKASLYSEVQMAARRIMAAASLERLLEARAQIRDELVAQLSARAAAWGVEVVQVDLKDIILPGEMKELLNRVIEAEKQAAANVILRREETSAMRAQANAARQMAENDTLMRLRELDTLKEIAHAVGSLTLIVSPEDAAGRLLRRGEGA